MAVADREQIAGVYLAGDNQLTWVFSDQTIEPDSLVVVEIDGQQRVGRVRIRPDDVVAGTVEAAGRILAPAGPEDLVALATDDSLPLASDADKRLGGIGRMSAGSSVDHNPLIEEFNSGLPRLGDRVSTDHGDGVVVRLRLHEAKVTVRLDTGAEIEVEREALAVRSSERDS